MRVKDRVEADKDKVRSIMLSPHHTHKAKPKIFKCNSEEDMRKYRDARFLTG